MVMNGERTLKESVEDLQEAWCELKVSIGESLHIFQLIDWLSKKLGD